MPGAQQVSCSENRMILDILDNEFRVEVTGFDKNRDVVVRAEPREAGYEAR